MSSFIAQESFSDFPLWEKISNKRIPLDFFLEITARCNNNCKHCYINLPAQDRDAKSRELSLSEISDIADQAVDMGVLWCLISGGEPLLRNDFFDIYLTLRNKGLLLSVFTNACLISQEHISFFQKYPPQDIEVSVYGISAETYEQVSRKPGSYQAFRRGLDLLLDSGLKIRLKAMALHSNFHELPEIAAFCRERSKTTFRFDPLLHLRYDQDPLRNSEIIEERLSPKEIIELEQADDQRLGALMKNCDSLIFPDPYQRKSRNIITCGAGCGSFVVSYDGIFRLCADLWHPETTYDLREGNLKDAWDNFVPKVRNMRSENSEFFAKCGNCQIVNLCMNCPAHSHLELGELDAVVPYFCEVAHARAAALKMVIDKKD